VLGVKSTAIFLLELEGIHDLVAVTLLREKTLAILGEVLVNGVARNKSVKVCGATVGFWSKKSA
jgi:hypothetical protein